MKKTASPLNEACTRASNTMMIARAAAKFLSRDKNTFDHRKFSKRNFSEFKKAL